jgi:outer membrane scaffolding protein for murein synthesis (MipA/OmpV family)
LLRSFALALLAIAVPSVASAQTPSPLVNWQYSVGETLQPLGGPVPNWDIHLGLGTEVQPQFEGAKRYEVVPSVDVDIRYKDIAFLSDGEGLGVNLLHGSFYRAGIAISYDLGRDHHDDPRLRTLHNVDPAPEGKLFAEIFVTPVVFTASLRQAIGGHGGLIGDLGAYVPLPLADDFYVFVGPGVTAANDTYMKAYFGVSPREAVGTSLTPFTPGGGLKNASFGVTSTWLINARWLLLGQAAYERLLGDAARSPVVESSSQFAFGLDLIYHF